MNKDIVHCAVGLLARREHSHKEIFQKLLKREFSPDDIDPVIHYLIEKNYLSDERFADCIFRSRVNKGYGWHYIQNELQHKGVSTFIINQLYKNSEIDWYLQAELAYNKRFGRSVIGNKQVHHKDNVKEKAKRMRFLQYRGFSTEQIMAILSPDS